MDFIQLLTAFGVGSIVSIAVQAFLTQHAATKQRNFQEKKEVYIGYLDAMYNSEIKPCEESASYVGHWHNRVELVGSKSVIQACVRIRETNPINDGGHPDRPQAMKELKEAMRKDLGVQPK